MPLALDRTPLVAAVSLVLSGLATLAAPSSTPAVPTAPAHPTRIVALGLPADELALALAPERVVAVDRFADDRAVSNVADDARAVPDRVVARAESIARLRPDLVLSPAWAPAELDVSLHALGIATLRLATASSVDDVRTSIRAVAQALDARTAREALVDELDASLATTRSRCAHDARPTVLLDAGSGRSPAAHTLLAELIDIAGGELLLARSDVGLAPLPLERELSLDPDVLLVDSYRADARARSVVETTRAATGLDVRLDSLRAVATGRVHRVDPRFLLTTTHHVGAAASAICDALHGTHAR
jgi:ABC-type Fe3+-hydroxamate transport system substrate-binding protein